MTTNTFFKELKQYNSTNYRALLNANLAEDNPITNKAFSSVLTRFFIYSEKHPEMSQVDKRILFFKLKLDLIARYFAEYPESDSDCLRPFQIELQSYAKKPQEEGDVDDK